MENKSVTANVRVNFTPKIVLEPTTAIRWYKPSTKAILQQFWEDGMGGGEWRDVEIVREI